jgi:hypothetical protein
MMQDKQSKEKHDAEPEKKPNENVGFYFSSSIKITDPQTGKVLVQKRCD